jgi:phosphatidate cytidylyltransferase
LIAAASIIVPLLSLVWLDDQLNGGRPGIWLGPLAVLIGVLACHEVVCMFQAGNHPVAAIPALGGAAAVLLLSLVPLAWSSYPTDCPIGRPGWSYLGMGVAVAIIFTWELVQYREPGQSLARLSAGVFAVGYTGLLMSYLIQLRFVHSGRVGLLAVVSTILIVKLSDAGAYFVGRSLGRNQLAPRVSPGKTMEGVAGGAITAAAGAWLVHSVLMPYFAPEVQTGALLWYLVYAVTLTLTGLLGDLSESILKRDVGQKDSSQWLPGLGGILDIIDSMLSTAPVSFAWWVSGLLLA